MKIGVSSYSFNKYMANGTLNQLTCIKKAHELGFSQIEFTNLEPIDNLSEIEFAKILKEECAKYGIEISAYVVGANLARRDENKLNDEIKYLKHCVDVSSTLGAKNMRHDVMYDYSDFRSFEDAIPTISKACLEVSKYAKGLGIRTMTENHGLIFQDAERMEKLVMSVNYENYGLLIDIGNFLCADCDVYTSISKLANYAFFVHAKNFKVYDYTSDIEGGFETRACNKLIGTNLIDGDIDVKRCIKILKKANYSGGIDIEYEGLNDPIRELEASYKYLKNCII